jgi:hypothetical protein
VSPRALIIVGAVCGIYAATLSLFAEPTAGTVVMAFVCGALFGKGYGVWKERSKPAQPVEEK